MERATFCWAGVRRFMSTPLRVVADCQLEGGWAVRVAARRRKARG